MDAIQQISSESFRLINSRKQQHSLEETLGRSFDASSFIEMDLDFFSMRWLDLNLGQHQIGGDAAVNADQIFFAGRVLPLHLANRDPIASPDSVLLPPSKSSSPRQSESSFSAYSDSPISAGRFGEKQNARSPAKILKKCLRFLVPLYRKVRKLKMISPKAPRRRMSDVGLRGGDWRRPVVNRIFDLEAASSIHDAVLHCKKSNGECFAEEKSG